MNAVEYVLFIFSGPEPKTSYYGDFLWIASMLAIYLDSTKAIAYPLWLITFGLVALHFLLNIYQMHTARPLPENAQFGELKAEITEQIDAMAALHGVIVIKKQLVTNFSTINAFCARSRSNAEIYVSHHWLESDEGKVLLMHILCHEIGHAFYNDTLNRGLFNSACFSAITITTFMIYNSIAPLWPYSFLIVITLQALGRIASSYLQAAYNRYTEFRADAFGATSSSPEEMQNALLFLENLNPYDKATFNLPEWKQGTHPKTVNRMARLEAIKGKKQC